MRQQASRCGLPKPIGQPQRNGLEAKRHRRMHAACKIVRAMAPQPSLDLKLPNPAV
jgi:hypothetical protein